MFTVASKFKISSNKLNGGIKKTYATKTINHWRKKLKKDGRIFHACGLIESILWKWLYYRKQSIHSMQSLPKFQQHSSQRYKKQS
jgi:hypothetical protein